MQIDFIAKDPAGKIFDTSIKAEAEKAGIFDQNKKYAPLNFKVGAGQIFTGLEEGVLGMKIGQKKTIVIPPNKAYGLRSPNLISIVPLSIFIENGITPKQGMAIKLAQGIVHILEVSKDSVKLDSNHPLAGQTIVLEVTILGLTKENKP